MTRRGWLISLAVLVLGAGLAAKALQTRRENAAPAAAASAAGAASATTHDSALELAADDLLTVGPLALQRGVTVSGSLKAVQTAVLKAKVAGELVELLPREGDLVQAGQPVGRIDATEAQLRVDQAQHQADAARAQLDVAQRQRENNQALVGQGFISATALDTSVSNEAAAQASLKAALAGVDLAKKALGDTRLLAPLSGLVAQRLAQPGERVAVDGRVLEIVDLSRLELEAAVPPEEAGQLRPGAAASLTVEGIATPVPARIARINPSTQAGTRAVLVYLALQPQAGPMAGQMAGLRQGLFARGLVGLSQPAAQPRGASTTVALPLAAVQVNEALPYVLRLAPLAERPGFGRLERQTVSLGARGQPVATKGPASTARPAGADAAAEEWVEIRSGLAAGQQVLRGGLGQPADGTLVKLPVMSAASTGAASTAPAASAAAAR